MAAKGKGKKKGGGRGKKGGDGTPKAKKLPKVAEGLAPSEMSKGQLCAFIKRLLAEKDRELEERNLFMLEKQKLWAFWQLTMDKLALLKDEVRDMDIKVDQSSKAKEKENEEYNKKLRMLQNEEIKNFGIVRLNHLNYMRKVSDEIWAIECILRESALSKKKSVRRALESYYEIIRALRLAHATSLSDMLNKLSQAIRNFESFEDRKFFDHKNEAEESLNPQRQIMKNDKMAKLDLMNLAHERTLLEMKTFFDDVTTNNLAVMSTLAEEVETQKLKENRLKRDLESAKKHYQSIHEPLRKMIEEMKAREGDQKNLGKLLRSVRKSEKIRKDPTQQSNSKPNEMKSSKGMTKTGTVDGQTRDLTTPYKLPPTPQDEELWFDEIMKLNRLALNRTIPKHSHSSNNQRVHIDSGNFRVNSATIWDPHPSYRFRAFGKDWRLDLTPSTGFISPEFRVTEHGLNESTVGGTKTTSDISGCFYNGVVEGDGGSSVAVSLCHGMTGHIRTSDGSFFIEPMGEWKGPHDKLVHVIYKLPVQNIAHHDDLLSPPVVSKAYQSQSQSQHDNMSQGQDQGQGQAHTRRKRSMSKERYVELMITADSTMTSYHGANLRHYILTLLSIVALVYRDASIGNPINIALVNLHVLKNKDFGRKSGNNSTSGTSASDMLRNFCKWQKDMNELDDGLGMHHDTALLLTRETICRNPWLGKCDTLGLAELGTMCDHYASCALVQDNGLSAAFTIAHELGHVLNMPHDDDARCAPYALTGNPSNGNGLGLGKSTGNYVMSRMLDHNTYPWAWSRCSRHFLTEFLDAGHGSCLEDTPSENLIVDTVGRNGGIRQPGEIFSEHKQCQLVFGQDSKLCTYMPVCRRLWCTTGDADVEGCRTQHMPWADGTPCGESKWCLKGACVLKDLDVLRVVDGGWGAWGEYGDCSRECGGGVRRSLRECDNPLPSNGGRYCIGPRVRYESCNTHECAGDSKDYRAEQCAQFNDDNFNIQGLPKDVQWVPKYSGISPKDSCKLWCRVMGSSAYYLLKEKVIDGTPCGPDTFDICVNGACLPAGCDRRLHSRKLLDICGVCGGDSQTCRTQGGSYNESSYGYSTVIRIPAGASSIDVRQTSATSRDDNYLALLDPTTNEYLLNGHFVVSMFKKNVHMAGTLIEYSGSDSTTERINCSRPLQSDIIVQVLSVGKLSRPNIVYQYVISIDNNNNQYTTNNNNNNNNNNKANVNVNSNVKYQWKLSEYSECSDACSGVAHPIFHCYRTGSGHAPSNSVQVAEHYCGDKDKSRGSIGAGYKPKLCNTNCKYSWAVTHKGTCSASCGKGHRNVTHACSALYGNSTQKFVSEDKCTQSSKPEGMEPCNVPCETPKWRYGPWGPCDSICGDGWSTRTAVCYFNNQVVDNGYCNRTSNNGGGQGEVKGQGGDGKKVFVRRKCNDRDCGTWKIDQWSPCSRTCGEGISRAAYACYLGSTILPPDYCINSQRPAVERKCDLPPCYSWVRGPVQCTTCGVNVTVSLQCSVFSNGQIVDDKYCAGMEPRRTLQDEEDGGLVYCGDCMPEKERLVMLDTGQWDEGDWSSCLPTSIAILENPSLAGNSSLLNFKFIRSRSVTCPTLSCSPSSRPPSTVECSEAEWKLNSRSKKGLWSTGKWSECNVTCGPGSESRTVQCTIDSVKHVSSDYCPSPAPPSTRSCTRPPCEWKTGPWGKCSKVCGHGIKIRQVKCSGSSASACEDLARPPDYESCSLEPCPLWMTGEWGECSSPCGGGVRERTVKCTDFDRVVEERKCIDAGVLKPSQTEACGEGDCREINRVDDTVVYRWHTGSWSNCTKPCGKGHKLRDVNCTKVEYSSGKVIQKAIASDERLCQAPKPRHKRGCARFPCRFKWITSPWSSCSRDCGYGIQERSVSCHRVNQYGWVDPDIVHYCDTADKPKNYNYCFLADCADLYRWKTENWTDCPAAPSKCGKLTRQKRRVYCISTRSNHRVNSNNCKTESKPTRKRKCPVIPCGQTSCKDLPDGNHVLVVAGKNITIYCHKGAEYINLMTEENFSEVYEKRLIRPETCPRGGVRLETCECIQDRNRRSGFTYYDKVRLNVTNLRVQGDNHEFTRQVTGSAINYGEAGDCYSSVNCPQGRFSINLNGTGLSVSGDTVWTSNGHRASMWIHKSKDNNVVTGKCGGYCGTCSPHRLTGIKLQIN